MRSKSRAKRWHGTVPADTSEARQRLLEAATACFTRHGVPRTTIDDIASEAGVHRSTVYEYFANREAVLAEVFVMETEIIMAVVAPHLLERPFLQGLVRGIARGAELTRRSPNLEFLFGMVSQGQEVRTAAAEEGWTAVVRKRLEGPVAAAIKRGEIRSDVPLPELLSWILRIAVSVTADPTGDVEKTLTWFLIPALRTTAASTSTSNANDHNLIER